jgi:hypothetical protein
MTGQSTRNRGASESGGQQENRWEGSETFELTALAIGRSGEIGAAASVQTEIAEQKS